MSAAGFVLAINIFVAGLFTAAFGTVAWRNRSAIRARWLAIAYSIGMANAALEFILPTMQDPALLNLTVFTVALSAFLVSVIGLARHYGTPVPWQALVLLSIAVLVFLLVSGLQFVAKPFLALSMGDPGTADYLHSLYGAYSQTLTAFLLIATGVLMLLIIVRDEMAAITLRSETDKLSGLWNRRGFENHTERALVLARKASLPSALVVADLDHFKHINDTLGHAWGDTVITAFARLLTDNAEPRMVVARQGGEEFAVLLPGANLATARLYAEGVRVAFSGIGPQLGISALSASFGVVQLLPHDDLSDTLRRADQALYEAKKSGRNRVIVADPMLVTSNPEQLTGS